MSTLRRTLALLACAAALSSAAGPAAASARPHGQARHVSHASQSHAQVARAALDRLLAGQTYDGIRLDAAQVVTATVCFHGACATKQVRPEPTCDPSAGVCIGTALRAWRPNRFTTIQVELL